MNTQVVNRTKAPEITLVVWIVTSLVATVEQNRTTWLLLALIALAGRLGTEDKERLASAFDRNGVEAADAAGGIA